MGTRPRPQRAGGPRPSGQHFLRSDRLAAELVDQARVARGETVLEFGAGTGRFTRALSRRAGLVVAVELDPDLVERLIHGFRTNDRVRVLQGDFLEIPLPDEPFRVFGNLPFGLSTTTMRHLLDDVDSPMTRADLLIQFEAARKRACVWPSSLASLGWLPWWEFRLVRHVHRGCFDPPPPVDGAILSITRRDPPLLRAEQRAAFVRLLRNAFGGGSQPLRHSLAKRISGRSWRRLAHELGIAPSSSPKDLDVFDWVHVFRFLSALYQ